MSSQVPSAVDRLVSDHVRIEHVMVRTALPVVCNLTSMNVLTGGGVVELQLLKNVKEVHINSNADAAGAATAAAGEQTTAAVPGGDITCKIDPQVNAILATCCTNLDVDSALPFQVTNET